MQHLTGYKTVAGGIHYSSGVAYDQPHKRAQDISAWRRDHSVWLHRTVAEGDASQIVPRDPVDRAFQLMEALPRPARMVWTYGQDQTGRHHFVLCLPPSPDMSFR
ncbi:hypothetical protein DC363_09635 [Thalassorhabdomicrobium marinisediminis]|uniref:Uncharacterized protein n=1 Tax=Thalassorhabdomicrobium marinisediminis TaxID=2170577 RepID=A0A2T7FX86_9RHOB|nr:hypothetical protein DC363_09635 [Thalassorhabdomicrobium marinisediminis]